MNKGKQTTLFQSWGPNKSERASHIDSNDGKRPTVGGSSGVIDLCEEDDDDDILVQAADETLGLLDSHGTIGAGASSIHVHNTNENPDEIKEKQHSFPETAGISDVFNISMGAESLSSCTGLSQVVAPDGFDKAAGKLWIYPTNYPVRDYQYNIVHQSLLKNTMVTLPTGLGKTFIAAVVMYNFYRWYPQGKVVFMAPTKPLVAQQIEACYNIMGIPQSDTAEMTGNMSPTERRKSWHSRRVFFLTPQVLTNDLSRGTCPAEMVKCLVIDEAHKAQGNHAYCQVVRELVKYTKQFRVLALSATPGSDIKAVQQVLVNLLISHIELRTEDSIDIKQYSHERKVEKIVVPLGDELTAIKKKYLQVIELVVNRLKRQGALYAREVTSLSKFLILKARDAFRQNPPQNLPQAQYGVVEGDFALAMSLYHGLELLQLHGQRSFYNFLDGIINGEKGYGRTRSELTKNVHFMEIMQTLSEKFAPSDVRFSQIPADQRKPFQAGHPKMLKLQDVVLDHFNKVNQGSSNSDDSTLTRIMIFSQYRDSVTEITDMLKQHRPMVKAMSFIGQSSAGKVTKGFTQKEQLKVMKEFREGGYNTLISTCVGEEGLDIGEVDLIICFDAHKSPIRLVQRMGRTGRKREGRIVMLVTEGKEEQIYNQSQYSKRSIHKAILNGAKTLQFYNGNPRMVPEGWSPACHKMFITVKHNFKVSKPVIDTKGNRSKTGVTNKDKKKAVVETGFLTEQESQELEDKLSDVIIPAIPSRKPFLSLGEPSENSECGDTTLSLTEWMPWQNVLQPVHFVQHTKKTRDFVDLVQFIELQEHQYPNDDVYGREMRVFLNKEDLLQEEDTEEGTEKGVQIPKVSDKNKGLQKGIKRTNVKTKVRRSETLPNFESDSCSNSDEDLPAMDFGENKSDFNKAGKKDSNINVNCEESQLDSVVIEENAENVVRDINLVESVALTKDVCDKLEKNRIKKKSKEKKSQKCAGTLDRFCVKNKSNTLKKISPKGKKGTKGASLGNATIVELIEDSDSNDFEMTEKCELNVIEKDSSADQKERGMMTNSKEEEESNKVEDCDKLKGEECNAFSHLLPGFNSGNRNIPTENLEGCMESIPSPPSHQVVEEHTNLVCNLQELPPLDLLQLVDEWEKENSARIIRNMTVGENMEINQITKQKEISFNESSNLSKRVLCVSDSVKYDKISKVIDVDSVSSKTKMKPKISVPKQDFLVSVMMNQSCRTRNQLNQSSENKRQKDSISKSVPEEICKQPGDISMVDHHLKDAVQNENKIKNKSDTHDKSGLDFMSTQTNFTLGSKVFGIEESVTEQSKEQASKTSMKDKMACDANKDDILLSDDDEFDDPFPTQTNFALGEIFGIDNDFNDKDLEKTEIVKKETVSVKPQSTKEHDALISEKDVRSLERKKLSKNENVKSENIHEESGSSEDEFQDTQATFMLVSSRDFLLDDFSNEENDKGNNEGSRFTSKNVDERGVKRELYTNNNTKLEGFDEIDGINVNTDSRLCSNQSVESTETQFTFTQALACVHDSEEMPSKNSDHFMKGTPLNENIRNKEDSMLNGSGKQNTDSSDKSDENTVIFQNEKDKIDENIELDISDDSLDDMLPSFDLGFDINADIIPPSPCASQSSQKSFSKTFSQTMLRSRKSLASSVNYGETTKVKDTHGVKDALEAVSENNFNDIEECVFFTQVSGKKQESRPGEGEVKSGLNCTKGDHDGDEDVESDAENNESMWNLGQQPPETEYALGEGGVHALLPEQSPGTSNNNDVEQNTSHMNARTLDDEMIEDMDFEQQLALAIRESLKTATQEIATTSSASLHKGKDSPLRNKYNETFKSPTSDLDDSFVVRKKRKVAIIDSPVTPDALDRSEIQLDNDFKTPVRPLKTCQQKSNIKSTSSEDDSYVVGISTGKKTLAVSFNTPDDMSDDDDFDFEVSKTKVGNVKCSNWRMQKNKKQDSTKRTSKSPGNMFLDEEAEVSDEEGLSSDDFEGSELDRYDDSFVGEATQLSQRTADEMQAIYLKSVRSPAVNLPGRFKLKYGHDHDMDVFSQPPEAEESQYLQDSFCVDEEEEDEEDMSYNDLGEVTLMQDITCVGRRTRWSKPCVPQKMKMKVGKGRRRIKVHNNSSSEEDSRVDNSSLMEETPVKRNSMKKRVMFSSSGSSDDNTGNNVEYISLVNEEVASTSAHDSPDMVLSLKSRLEMKGKKVGGETARTHSFKTSISNSPSVKSEREERLERQRKKQEEYKQKMMTNVNTFSNTITEESKDFNKAQESNLLVTPLTNTGPNDRIVVIVDSREINGSQDLISDLRFLHKMHVVAAQLEGCDYILSNRICVDRKQWGEFSNGAFREKLVERVRTMVELYERPCLIIEKDKVKGDDKGHKPLHWTKYVDKTLVQLVQSKVTLYFTENQTDTAVLISELCQSEKRKRFTITVPVDLDAEKQEQLKFYTSVPKVTYVNALNLCYNFRTVSEFIRSSVGTIKLKGCMNQQRATEVYNYLHRTFDARMIPSTSKVR